VPYFELESVFIAWGVEYDETAHEHEWMSRTAANRAADSWLEKVAALDESPPPARLTTLRASAIHVARWRGSSTR
jgi:hypothetical protein